MTAVGGLYTYDPLARLYAASQRDGRTGVDPLPTVPAPRTRDETTPEDIGQFVTLGPLGTALLPWGRPRVLLIDEIDRLPDLDLPSNDLLTIFEDGKYEIPELVRQAEREQTARPMMSGGARSPCSIRDGAASRHISSRSSS